MVEEEKILDMAAKRVLRQEINKRWREERREVDAKYQAEMEALHPRRGRRDTKPRVRI